MVIQYDGTDFCGSQIQNGVRTVQGELEKAVSQAFNQEIKILFSGRTDSGVHAMEQIVNFQVDTSIPGERVIYPILKFLPQDINVLSTVPVAESFHARFDAKYRIYRYFIRKESNLFRNKFSFLCRKEFDLQKLKEFVPLFLGKKNFRSFCSAKAEVDHYFCDIEYINFFKKEDEIVLEIKANRYLHNMVRIIVATFIEINSGKLDSNDIEQIFEKENRIYAPQTISPKGLFLWKIGY